MTNESQEKENVDVAILWFSDFLPRLVQKAHWKSVNKKTETCRRSLTINDYIRFDVFH